MKHRCEGFDCRVCEQLAEERAAGDPSGEEQAIRRAQDIYERQLFGRSL